MKYKVGDKVTIKDWDSMVAEYGMRNNGVTIKVPFSFIRNMEYTCGNSYIIFNISDRNDRADKALLYTLRKQGAPAVLGYSFSEEMFLHSILAMPELNSNLFNEDLL